MVKATKHAGRGRQNATDIQKGQAELPGRPTRSQRWVKPFLAALEEGLSVSGSCKQAHVHRATAYKYYHANETFAEAWRTSYEQGTDALEDEARRRGVEGTEEPVFYQGDKCGTVRRYSDTLLILLLKARNPQKFRDSIERGQISGGKLIVWNIPTPDEAPAKGA